MFQKSKCYSYNVNYNSFSITQTLFPLRLKYISKVELLKLNFCKIFNTKVDKNLFSSIIRKGSFTNDSPAYEDVIKLIFVLSSAICRVHFYLILTILLSCRY